MLTCSSSFRCLRLAVVMMLVSLVHSRNLLERAGLWMEMLPALNTDSTEPSTTSGGGGLPGCEADNIRLETGLLAGCEADII